MGFTCIRNYDYVRYLNSCPSNSMVLECTMSSIHGFQSNGEQQLGECQIEAFANSRGVVRVGVRLIIVVPLSQERGSFRVPQPQP